MGAASFVARRSTPRPSPEQEFSALAIFAAIIARAVLLAFSYVMLSARDLVTGLRASLAGARPRRPSRPRRERSAREVGSRARLVERSRGRASFGHRRERSAADVSPPPTHRIVVPEMIFIDLTERRN